MASSPDVTLFLFSRPHIWHRCSITYSGEVPSSATGFMSPWQAAARSPGLTSTCLLHKHFGQWFVYPLPSTCTPQCSQVKSSIVRLKAISRACSETPSGLESQADVRKKRCRRGKHIEICRPRISRFLPHLTRPCPETICDFFLWWGFQTCSRSPGVHPSALQMLR